jgi:hypothetical protein
MTKERSHKATAAGVLAVLRKQAGKSHPGGEHRRCAYIEEERYCIDFGMLAEGWEQFDTQQDAPYFGVWTHGGLLEVLTCCEGDWTLSRYAERADYDRALVELRDYYGAAPAECVVITPDGQAKGMTLREALGGDA